MRNLLLHCRKVVWPVTGHCEKSEHPCTSCTSGVPIIILHYKGNAKCFCFTCGSLELLLYLCNHICNLIIWLFLRIVDKHCMKWSINARVLHIWLFAMHLQICSWSSHICKKKLVCYCFKGQYMLTFALPCFAFHF